MSLLSLLHKKWEAAFLKGESVGKIKAHKTIFMEKVSWHCEYFIKNFGIYHNWVLLLQFLLASTICCLLPKSEFCIFT